MQPDCRLGISWRGERRTIKFEDGAGALHGNKKAFARPVAFNANYLALTCQPNGTQKVAFLHLDDKTYFGTSRDR